MNLLEEDASKYNNPHKKTCSTGVLLQISVLQVLFLCEPDYKPGYVESDHLSRIYVTIDLKQPTWDAAGNCIIPRIPRRDSLFGLASDGVYRACSVTKTAVSSYLAFPPLPYEYGGLFLLHWPGSRLHRTLSGILPYEARTFLTCKKCSRDHLSDSYNLITKHEKKVKKKFKEIPTQNISYSF